MHHVFLVLIIVQLAFSTRCHGAKYTKPVSTSVIQQPLIALISDTYHFWHLLTRNQHTHPETRNAFYSQQSLHQDSLTNHSLHCMKIPFFPLIIVESYTWDLS